MTLPAPAENQPYCIVSALESGHIHVTDNLFIDNPDSDALQRVPSLSFLLQHSFNKQKFVFDLGFRKDWAINSPPKLLASIPPTFKIEVEQDVVESLGRGGLTTDDIDIVCLSHIHFDHIGHSPLFKKSQFVVGGGTAKVIEGGLWPLNADSVYPADAVPMDRTRFLGEDVHWECIGPFPRAYNFYGDGSLYIIDAPGHLWGHVNLLARTSADGGWIYLAGDTAHHWNLVTGKSGIACSHPGHAISHQDKEVAEQSIMRVGQVSKLPRVRVLLAHDKPWYDENEGGDAFFPGKIESL